MTLKPGLGSLKGIKTDTYRSATYDFLLTFHSNHGPILYRFRGRRRFQSKITKISHPLYFASPLNWVSALRVKKLEIVGYRAEKKVWRYLQPSGYNTPKWRTNGRTDGHIRTPGDSKDRAYVIKRIASRSKNVYTYQYFISWTRRQSVDRIRWFDSWIWNTVQIVTKYSLSQNYLPRKFHSNQYISFTSYPAHIQKSIKESLWWWK